MITKLQVDELEALIGQLFSLHSELTGLTKKSSTDAVNNFKLKLINKTLERCNGLLGTAYRPFDDFALFDSDDVPSNSDVTLVLGQYQSALENFRSEHIHARSGHWFYDLPEGSDTVRAMPPARLTKRG
jgi:hypothetical protein